MAFRLMVVKTDYCGTEYIVPNKEYPAMIFVTCQGEEIGGYITDESGKERYILLGTGCACIGFNRWEVIRSVKKTTIFSKIRKFLKMS